jgi:hypothetical protein
MVLAGCRAQVGGPDDAGDMATDDMHVGDDGDMGGVDLLSDDGACSGAPGPEICNNNCDDDRNGYIDGDDPACSTQLLVTTQTMSSTLSRLILDPMPHLATVDGNMVGNGGMAFLDHGFLPNTAFLVFTSGVSIRKLTLSPSGTGTASNYTPPAAMQFPTRDVCTFNNELIVLERGNPSVLHRFMSDGQTPLGTVSINLPTDLGITTPLATSCASDGKLLYVSVHDTLPGTTSTFLAYDSNYQLVGNPSPMPAGIASYGGAGSFDRCLDFAWSAKSGFWGVFVLSTDFSQPANDNTMSGGQLFPFGMDGGSGAPVDAGVFYGVGQFMP